MTQSRTKPVATIRGTRVSIVMVVYFTTTRLYLAAAPGWSIGRRIWKVIDSEHELHPDEIQSVPSQGDRPLPTHLSQRRRLSQYGRHGHMHPQHILDVRLPIHQQTHAAIAHVDGKGRFIPTFATFKSPCFANCFGSFVAHRRSEEHTSELQSPCNLVCRLLL